MLREQIETLIIGGGQAGLAMSYCLSQLGREHLVFERRRVADRWRSERWDSLMFQSPNWNVNLPGFGLQSADPDAFSTRDDVVRFIESYASFIRAPLRCGVAATALWRKPGTPLLMVETSEGPIQARNVVIATGPFQTPVAPAFMGGRELELHASQYRNPQQLPPGAILVVGSGNSGCQIAEELCSVGRRVYLSVGKYRRVPRRHRGKDYFWWYLTLGDADTTIDQRQGGMRPSILITGVGGGHDVDLRRLAFDGVVLLGRVLGDQDGRLAIAADLRENLSRGDKALSAFIDRAEEYAARNELNLPPFDGHPKPWPDPKTVSDPIMSLDLAAANISTIVWANGYRYDHDWIDLPIFAGEEPDRVPVHKRGITTVPGVYFLGLPWLHKLKSSFLHGVGEDAAYIAERIAANARV